MRWDKIEMPLLEERRRPMESLAEASPRSRASPGSAADHVIQLVTLKGSRMALFKAPFRTAGFFDPTRDELDNCDLDIQTPEYTREGIQLAPGCMITLAAFVLPETEHFIMKVRELPLRKGRAFSMSVLVTTKAFLISYNEEHFAAFPHRMPAESVNSIGIYRGLKLAAVYYEVDYKVTKDCHLSGPHLDSTGDGMVDICVCCTDTAMRIFICHRPVFQATRDQLQSLWGPSLRAEHSRQCRPDRRPLQSTWLILNGCFLCASRDSR
uniref:Galectin n=1 Tax=Macrostomum lignano TaxID=282301 RepID=A0A1I8FIU0_9PLAT